MMNKKRLHEIKERLKDTGNKSWEFSYIKDKDDEFFYGVSSYYKNEEGVDEEYIVCDVKQDEFPGRIQNEENIEFIANSKADIEWLILELEIALND